MGFIRGQHIISRLILLQHQPHTFHIIPCKAPVPLGIHIPQGKLLLLSCQNIGNRQRDFPGNEILAPSGRFMIKQNPVTGEHIIRLPVIHRNPVRIQLRHTIRALGIKRRFLTLGSRLRQPAEQLGGRCLIKTARTPIDPNGLQKLQRTHSRSIRRIFRDLKGNTNMRLRRQVIHLGRLDFRHQPHQSAGIRRVRIMKKEFNIIIGGMNQMVNPAGNRNTVTPHQAMHLIPLLQ